MALTGDDDLAISGRLSFGSSSFHDVFTSNGCREDDEEEPRWAAIERLSTYDRMRKSVLTRVLEDGTEIDTEVDVKKLGIDDKRRLMSKLLNGVDDDNYKERFLHRLRSRADRCVLSVCVCVIKCVL